MRKLLLILSMLGLTVLCSAQANTATWLLTELKEILTTQKEATTELRDSLTSLRQRLDLSEREFEQMLLGLQDRLELSETEFQAILTALRADSQSLTTAHVELKNSFKAYQAVTDSEISRLSRTVGKFRLFVFLAGVISAISLGLAGWVLLVGN